MTITMTVNIYIPDASDPESIREAVLAALQAPVRGEPETVVTVEDYAGLDALPLGTLIEDKDGDVFRKTEAHRYVCTSSEGVVLYDFDAITDYLPGRVLNPEVLGTEWKTEVVPDAEMIGAFVGDPDGLHALPDYSIIQGIAPCAHVVRQKIDGHWYCAKNSTSLTAGTTWLAGENGAVVLYVPEANQ